MKINSTGYYLIATACLFIASMLVGLGLYSPYWFIVLLFSIPFFILTFKLITLYEITLDDEQLELWEKQ